MWIFVKIQTIEASQKIWAHNSHFKIFFEYLRIHICLDSCVPPYFNRLSLFLVHVIRKWTKLQSFELNEFRFFQIRFAKIYFQQQKRSNSKFTSPFPIVGAWLKNIVVVPKYIQHVFTAMRRLKLFFWVVFSVKKVLC